MYPGAKKDFFRLCDYAIELGFDTRIQKKMADSAGTFNADLKLITIEKSTFEDMVLTLLHELGHVKDWIASGCKNRVGAENALVKNPSDLSPKDRWNIYIDECHGIAWMLKISRQLELNIPYQKVCIEQEMDRLIYKNWADTGKEMSKTERNHHRDVLNKIWLVK